MSKTLRKPGRVGARVNLFSAKNVGWISAAHPPCQLKKVDALRLSTLLLCLRNGGQRVAHPTERIIRGREFCGPQQHNE